MTCPDCEALRLRAEVAEARIESVSGMTRLELVAREEAKRAAAVQALKTTLGNLRSLKGNAFRNLSTINEWLAVVESALADVGLASEKGEVTP